MKTVNNASFDGSCYKPGSIVKRILWYFTNAIFFKSCNPLNGLKVYLLRLFGARVGKGVVIKPAINIKYPWFLEIGNDSWIGEEVWIDSMQKVIIGNNVCISQGALLLCGNHDYKKTSFDYKLGKITLEDGVWIGSKSTVCPGITCFSHSVLTVGSVATKNMEAYTVYSGNPAIAVRKREITQ